MEKRISALSSTEDIFRNAAPPYNKALQDSGYEENIEYKEVTKKANGENRKRKNRGRNITWFNPPYSANVKTNVGSKFLKLVEKHFPKGHKLNKNTVKVNYSCMKNVDSIIKNHNQRVIKQSKTTEAKKDSKCNCQQKVKCPLGGNCLETAIVYKATVRHDDQEKHYFGITGGHSKKGTETTKNRSSMRNTAKKHSSRSTSGT